MEIIDTHCHLQKFHESGELDPVLERAREAGVGRMITIGTSSGDWSRYRELTERHAGRLDYTVGLHPSDVDTDWEEQVAQLSTYFIPPVQPVGLGEIGLDHFHLPSDPIEAGKVIQRQEAAFQTQLDLALQLDCPVVIHSRGAVKECMEMIDRSGVDWTRVVFHCWTDGPQWIRELTRRGGYASFTGIATYKNAEEVREAAVEQGLDRLMIETDAPYLAPVPMRGKGNEPAFLRHTAESLAETFGVTSEELAARTTRNATAFFNLS